MKSIDFEIRLKQNECDAMRFSVQNTVQLRLNNKLKSKFKKSPYKSSDTGYKTFDKIYHFWFAVETK